MVENATMPSTENNAAALPRPGRRRLRWIIFLLPGLIPVVMLGAFVGYEMTRPLPDYSTLPPATLEKIALRNAFSSSVIPAEAGTPELTTRTLARQVGITTEPLLAVRPPWPPFTMPADPPQALKEQTEALARLHDELEVCRQAFEKYAAVAGRLDYGKAIHQVNELRNLIDLADEHKDAILFKNYPVLARSGPLREAEARIVELREADNRFSLDLHLRHGNWKQTGNFLYYVYRDWDSAVFYWRKTGLEGSMLIGQAGVDRLVRGIYHRVVMPAVNVTETIFGKTEN